ncbi:MAG: mycothiol synthase [Pseudonocardiales bacterium]|jgi:mycothiol synthase|nr:mycothiol synthase [Pseudonocardiales bacterium]
MRTEILRLAASVEAADGAPPLSDQSLSHLGSGAVTHLLARDGDHLAGYAQLDGRSLEIAADDVAISPLLDAATEATVGDLLVWSHGRRSRLVPVLTDRGFDRVRELHQLRRPLDDDASPLPPDPPLADDVVVRAFVSGVDDEAWLALNAAAFAEHREQGSWTIADLQARIAEPWFDAAGFLLAERGSELLGFHWTKVHADGAGEVYVLGISPEAQGLGLGNALLIRGLRLLAQRGCPHVLLYVDGDNPAALRLYERAGFVRFDLDVQWQEA